MERQELERSLCLGLASAQVIPYQRVSLQGWSPAASACHENVDRWVSETIGNVAVRGWVVYMPSVFADGRSAIILTAHSIVRGEDGTLYDITPLSDERVRPFCRFVAHIGSEESFWTMKNENNLVWCPDYEDGR